MATQDEFLEMSDKCKKHKEDKKIFHFKKEQLQLECEWHDCKEVLPVMEEFLRHVSKHLEKCSFTGDFHCCWRDCGYILESSSELNIHVNYHAFHAKLKCLGANLLMRKGLQKCSLNSNTRNCIPELPDNLICGWANCGFVFQSPELYYRHVDQHVEDVAEQSIKCQWEGCKGQFQNGHKLRDHFRSHTQEKLIACPTCGGLFSNRTKFLDHIKRQTPVEDQQYQCTHCSKRLASERLLRDHMRNHINHYKCPQCDMTCSSPSNLRNHIKYRHSNTRPYTCSFCKHSCKSQPDLFKHFRSHLLEPHHQCTVEDCNFVTRSARCLKSHINKEHKKTDSSRYACHLCEKKFARGAYLTRHLFRKHKLRWPSGHSRFRYQKNQNGEYHLQTIRYESIELTQELIDQNCDDDALELSEDNLTDSSGEDIIEVDESGQECNDNSVDSVPLKSSTDSVGQAVSFEGLPVNVEQDQTENDDFKNARTVLATVSGPNGVSHVITVLVNDNVPVPLDANSELNCCDGNWNPH